MNATKRLLFIDWNTLFETEKKVTMPADVRLADSIISSLIALEKKAGFQLFLACLAGHDENPEPLQETMEFVAELIESQVPMIVDGFVAKNRTEYYEKMAELINRQQIAPETCYLVIHKKDFDEKIQGLTVPVILFSDGKTAPEGYSVVTEWNELTRHIRTGRKAYIKRKTNETDVKITLNLDKSSPKNAISTGVGFFDHALHQIARHAQVELDVTVIGDLYVDTHHSIEDTGIALGEAFRKALGDKTGIERYGHFSLPMDDCLANVAIDFGGRSWLVWNVKFNRELIGDMPTEMFYHFFKSFCDSAACNMNITATGSNEHHKIEAVFKAVAKAIKMAIKRDEKSHTIPSTKGVF